MEAAAALLLRILVLAVAAGATGAAGDGCTTGCDLALASFFVRQNQNLSNIAALFGIGVANYRLLAPYNPNISNLDFINFNTSVNVSLNCRCLSLPAAPSSTYLAGSLPFRVSRGQTYTAIADNYNNLTTAEWLQATNNYPANNITENDIVNVTVNCSCGDASISPDYGLFLTYPLRDRETLASVGASNGFSSPSQMDMLRRYNPGMDNVTGRGLVYIPVKAAVSLPSLPGAAVRYRCSLPPSAAQCRSPSLADKKPEWSGGARRLRREEDERDGRLQREEGERDGRLRREDGECGFKWRREEGERC